jgi:hypothetical protein
MNRFRRGLHPAQFRRLIHQPAPEVFRGLVGFGQVDAFNVGAFGFAFARQRYRIPISRITTLVEYFAGVRVESIRCRWWWLRWWWLLLSGRLLVWFVSSRRCRFRVVVLPCTEFVSIASVRIVNAIRFNLVKWY